ncbi:MAG: class I SAM-dependent methyltransferase [Deltaproteobacteria bacterium]|nr:class I SAM-dependent methyltransferase [Deltaproteobacteria bacterium]
MTTLDDKLVDQALAAGGAIDLADCVYGPSHTVRGAFAAEVQPYYALLAGLVRVLNARTVLELGTHFGGATLAMARGLADPRQGLVVTVDVTALPNEALDREPVVRRVHGDLFAPRCLRKVERALDGRPVDLLFIDIVHGYHQTRRALGWYANRVQPALIALDDVRLNGGMRLLWDELRARYPALDASERVERAEAGFGLLQPHRPMRLDEGDAWRALLWSARRAMALRTPARVKRGVNAMLDRMPAPLRKRIDPS